MGHVLPHVALERRTAQRPRGLLYCLRVFLQNTKAALQPGQSVLIGRG